MLLRLALRRDILIPLTQRPASFQDVALVVCAGLVGIHYLLNYLTCLSVLTCQDDQYALTPSTAVFFVRASPSYVSDLIQYDAGEESFKRVRHALQDGKPIFLTEQTDQDAWLESYSTEIQAQDMFRRVHTWLVESGVYVLGCPMGGETLTEQPSFLLACSYERTTMPVPTFFRNTASG